MIKYLIVFALLAKATNCQRCFQCYDDCIDYSLRCDAKDDCYSGEDEEDCEFICPYRTHYRCSDTGLCIDNYHVCDGRIDCVNGEDEERILCGHRGGFGSRLTDFITSFISGRPYGSRGRRPYSKLLKTSGTRTQPVNISAPRL